MPQSLVLAVETSHRNATIALLEGTAGNQATRIAEQTLTADQSTAQMLVPVIRDLLVAQHRTARDLGAIAVSTGPGSFTGLRIGVAAAKMLAYATNAKLAGVNTLDTLAAQVAGATGKVWAVLDAQRGDVFAACYAPEDQQSLGEIDRTELLSSKDWLARLSPGDTVVGPVLARYGDSLADGVTKADESLWLPQASTVGQLGWHQINQSGGVSPFMLVPQYHRLSAAEEKARAGKK